MINKIRVDYHFHPNFPLYMPIFRKARCARRAKMLWKTFEKKKLNVILISEHSFKKPKTSFEILEKYKPKNAKTIIIPAVEVVTKEGTDIIVFAKDKEYLYSQKILLQPQKQSLIDLVDFIEKDEKLHGIVVHPYMPGSTSIIKNNGEIETIKAIERLGYVEGYNSSISTVISLINFLRLKTLLKNTYQRLHKTIKAPDYLLEKAKLITGGSDAHSACSLGDHIEIELKGENLYKDYFDIITKRQGKFVSTKNGRISKICFCGIVSLTEGFMRKSHIHVNDKIEE